MEKKILTGECLQNVATNRADEVTGKEKGMVRNGWFYEECA
jgi:hypothetical protein